MAFIKKLLGLFSENSKTTPNLTVHKNPSGSGERFIITKANVERFNAQFRREYPRPDYNAYVYIRNDADIYQVTVSKNVKNKYPAISQKYYQATAEYRKVEGLPQNVRDCRKSFNLLNDMFEKIVNVFCTDSGIKTEGHSLVRKVLSLKYAGFTQQQMNVMYGALAKIEDNADSNKMVIDYDIKVHFVTMGIVMNMFKEFVEKRNVNNVAVSFSEKEKKRSMNNEIQALTDKNEKKANSKSSPKVHAKVSMNYISQIDNHLSVVKTYRNSNSNKEVVASLKLICVLANEALCDAYSINLKGDAPAIAKELFNRGYVDEKYSYTVEKVVKMAECAQKGRQLQKNEVDMVAGAVKRKVFATLNAMRKKDCPAKAKSGKKGNAPVKKSEPKATTFISFKKLAKKKSGSSYDIKNEYPDLFENIANARQWLREGKYSGALNALRTALEVITLNICKKYNMSVGDETLENKIDLIVKVSGLSKAQKDILHKVRILGNQGSHYNENAIANANDVQKCLSLVEQAANLFENIMADGNVRGNLPAYDPDYYMGSRKYYGRWYNCFTVQELMMNKDYVVLSRAAQNGDVEAMLNIANVFLPSKINWDISNSLINGPASSMYFQSPDTYDARYYYWILKACCIAYENWKAQKPVPLTYIATALLEAIKFSVYHKNAEKAFSTIPEANQYRHALLLFGGNLFYGEEYIKKYAQMLIALLNEFPQNAEGASVISPVHGTVNENTLRRYVYMFCYLDNGYSKVNFEPQLLLNITDSGKTFADVVRSDKALGKWCESLSYMREQLVKNRN